MLVLFASHYSGMVRKAVLPVLALGLVALLAPATHAQANINFTRIDSTMMRIDFITPVTYNVFGSAESGTTPVFVFRNVGDLFGNSQPSFTGSLSFRINGGPTQTLNQINSGVGTRVVSADDIYIYGALTGLDAGDVVTLTSGSLIVPTNGTTVRNGAYSTYIVAGGAPPVRVSSFGIAVAPEPASLALVSVGSVGMFGIIARRKARP